ncbi:glycosyltransferase family 2 protein [Paraclostridium bifermentans]|uniref:glycosyltransferase family 2 protein n=1 Tax=Paraclostridium bifermentans TaxID=1490 RepID=UPI0018A935F6|nr:glycosyltransferase family 2 protein [Paraclostridium bifermentans]
MVDILMATYNGEEYIKDQLDSIINQTYKDWILYIRDDGSTDRTVDIISNYTRKYPNKIFFIKDEKNGLGAKLNFGELMKFSKNSYCMFADQDDVWLNDKISKTLDAMKKNEEKYCKETPILIHTDLKVVDKDLNILNNSFLKFQNINPKRNLLNHLIISNTVTGCTMMLNKALVNKVGYIPEEAKIHDWWIAIIASKLGKIYTINEATMLYRQHGNNTCGAKEHSYKLNVNRIKDRIKENVYKKIVTEEYVLNVQQIKKFYTSYEQFLTESDKKIIKEFIDLRENSYLSRKRIVIKNKFFTGRIQEDLPFLIYI